MDGRRAIEPDDLFRFRFVTAADLSPGGHWVVFARTRTDIEANTDHSDLFLHEVATGWQRQLTHADAVHTQPAFSPDGREIAFLSTRAGAQQIFVIARDGGEPRQITELPRGVGGGPVWSPDGSALAFTAGPQEQRDTSQPYRVRRAIWRADGIGLVEDALQDVYVVDPDNCEPSRLTADEFLNTAPRWTPDGRSLVYIAGFDPESVLYENRLRRADLDGVVTEVAGGGLIASHAVCPDGRIAYVLTNELGAPPGTRGGLWVHDPETGVSTSRTAESAEWDVGGRVASDLPSLGFTMGTLTVSPDSRFAYLPAQRGGEVHVIRVGLSGAEFSASVVSGKRLCAPIRLQGRRILFAAFDVGEPGDLHLFDTESEVEQRLTHLNEQLLAELELPAVHRVEFTSTDGTGVEGWFLEPTAGARPYPTLLSVHGGPHAGWGRTFCFDFLMLAGAGYGVLYVNHRGSTGYGDEFATAINSDWGDLDYEDLMAGVDHAVERGLADPDRLGVFGVSGGAMLTGTIVGRTDRFKAASPENPLFDFVSLYGTSDLGYHVGHTSMGGPPHERAEVYRRCSPITLAHRCATPTLLLQHENDHRTPPGQSEQFYGILKAQGVTVEMLRFPETPHAGSLVGPVTHRRAQNEALLEWMNTYVRDPE